MNTVTLQRDKPGFRERPQRGDLWKTIGSTPLLRLRRVTSELSDEVKVYVKAEWFNPAGSVKDRPAAEIIRQALTSGSLEGGKVLLDSTSGNMGIAYATLASAIGLRVHLAIPSNASPPRLAILRAMGAELTLTDPLEGTDGARRVAAEMASSHPQHFTYADQYSNPANWQAHERTTAPEILAQTGGALTHFVAGLGTTGTMMGAGRFLRASLPHIRLVAVQPASPLHGLEGLKHLPSENHPSIYNPACVDEIQDVHTEEAYAMARRLAREEGLLVGISAAAAAVAALRVAESLQKGFIVVLFPDSGLKYLNQSFWSES